MAELPSSEYLVKAFRHFAQMCSESRSPLYAKLSAHVAEDERVRSLAGCHTEHQPACNLLFGAVQYLLLRGAQHELRTFYPSVGGTADVDDAWPVFRNFCEQHRDKIVQLVATRRVQTNEVARCGPLVIGMGVVEKSCAGRPLGVIELGASAGLNLQFDQFHYHYDDGRTLLPSLLGVGAAHSSSRPVNIRTELRGDRSSVTPIPDKMPRVSSRIGIDIDPVDVMNDEAVDWVASMIWADQVDRIELFRTAVEVARSRTPQMVRADAQQVIAQLIYDLPADATPCVYHTHATYQMTKEWRSSFESQLLGCARDCQREIAHLSIEWLGDDEGPQMRLIIHRPAQEPLERHLASCHHHGRWIAWRETID